MSGGCEGCSVGWGWVSVGVWEEVLEWVVCRVCGCGRRGGCLVGVRGGVLGMGVWWV